MIGDLTPVKKHQIYWTVTILIAIIISIFSTVYSLSRGIYEVFPFIYFLPIILFVYFYPNRGVLFSLGLSTVYLLLVYLYSNVNPYAVAISTAWFVVFVTIGVVTSSFATGLREEERKYRGIFENSQAGLFTFDRDTTKIAEINEKCAQMLRYERAELIGAELSRIMPDTESRDRFVQQIREFGETGDLELLFTAHDGTIRQFLVSASVIPGNVVICSAIDITSRKMAEQVTECAQEELKRRVDERTEKLLRANEDLTAELEERKRFEAAFRLANHKLSTLYGITRHDILNQITAVVMYLSLIQESVTDPVLSGYLKKIEELTQMIQKQIRFTRNYDDLVGSEPGWHNVSAVISGVAAEFDQKNVVMNCQFDDLEIFADAAFPKVFLHLIENASVHRNHVTAIRFFYRKTEDELILSCENNGVSIPDVSKEQTFGSEYPSNGEYGLFLIKEILNNTGFSIKETGTPGSGAGFDIHVPNGSYRFIPRTNGPAPGH